MYKQFFQQGLQSTALPMFAFALFGLAFLAVLLWVGARGKAAYRDVERLPLQDDQEGLR